MSEVPWLLAYQFPKSQKKKRGKEIRNRNDEYIVIFCPEISIAVKPSCCE